MPIQAATQWTEYLNCPVCEHGFDIRVRLPISLGCGHTICKTCLFNLQRNQCPFDSGVITVDVEILPINTALMLLIESGSSRVPCDLEPFRNSSDDQVTSLMKIMESLALFLKPSSSLSRSMQRKLITLINCQLMEDEGRLRAVRAARSLSERTVTELILHHQNPQQLSANLWAAVRGRGCQFLGPAMQEEVLALVLLALENGEALSRKVLVMYVVQRLEPQFPQASKTSIGHVVQLLYRASCFKVTKREGDSSLMQLKEEFRTYDALRREHDMQIVQIATEAGLRIAPDQWSSLLYGDTHHKSQMQSIMDKLQTPELFSQSVQELVIALQKTGDPGKLTELRPSLDFLAGIDPAQDTFLLSFDTLSTALVSVNKVLSGLVAFVGHHSSNSKRGSSHSSNTNANTAGSNGGSSGAASGSSAASGDPRHARYKTNLCRDLSIYGFCPRGKNCTFAHSLAELEQHRGQSRKTSSSNNNKQEPSSSAILTSNITPSSAKSESAPLRGRPGNTPVAQVAPLPRRKLSRSALSNPGVPPPSTPALPIQFHVLSDVYGPPHHRGVPYSEDPVIHYASPHYTSFIDGGESGGGGGSGGVPKEIFKGDDLKRAKGGGILRKENGSKQKLNDEIVSKSIARIATKSLSALQSRKEEIIYSLEDLMGKDEASKLSQEFEELSFQKEASEASGLEVAPELSREPSPEDSTYSMWTTKSIVSLAPKNSLEAAAAVAQEQAIHEGLEHVYSIQDGGEDKNAGTWSVFHQSYGAEDDIYPLPDVPLVSRFGPISRRCNTLLKPSVPSQTQASMDDGTVPTDVVTNAKQITHQMPSMTSPWLYQNGIMSVQPVAVGPNGEVGYILLAPEQPLLLQNSIRRPLLNHPPAIEKEVVKAPKAETPSKPEGTSEVKSSDPPGVNQIRQDQLSNELFIIESSIRDREREISMNHMQEASISDHRGALDYGSYISQGLMSTEEEDESSMVPTDLSNHPKSSSSPTSASRGRNGVIQAMSEHFHSPA
eukprot:TRINITY_DN468_c0_g1_i5.p1 TRINITY_DN468_c0_g1~~TRINITY_DN468_c0_g1_i5.p1  ORF type:complete len:1005 (+),score=300.74 TRINITY_DN468_c0_g1_i5:505-3519(+)